jgi:hypothetical protein
LHLQKEFNRDPRKGQGFDDDGEAECHCRTYQVIVHPTRGIRQAVPIMKEAFVELTEAWYSPVTWAFIVKIIGGFILELNVM